MDFFWPLGEPGGKYLSQRYYSRTLIVPLSESCVACCLPEPNRPEANSKPHKMLAFVRADSRWRFVVGAVYTPVYS